MSKYLRLLKNKYGQTERIDINGWDKTHAIITLNGVKPMRLKMYYRHERTWDDHLGNTPCGYFVIARLSTGERKRIYLH